MASDLEHVQSDTGESKRSSGRILQHELREALDALDRSTSRLCVSGLSAGLDIGFSLLLIAVVRTQAEGVLPVPVVELLLATMYSFGFIIVVLGRSELFTEQTALSVLPLLSGHTTLYKVARLWAIVYVSNLVGTALFAGLAAVAIPSMGVVERGVLQALATEVTDHPGWVIFVSGILAGWMMGLLSWLVAAGRDTISQIVIVWIITAGIGLARLHHAILGAVKVFTGVFSGAPITVSEVAWFLLWVTLGNAVGGAFFVSVIKYGHARPSRHHRQTATREMGSRGIASQ